MTILPEAAPASGSDRARQVRRLFSEIAPRYDLLNHVLSLNVDRSWRRKAVAELDWSRAPGGVFLDACAGTFDLSLELTRRKGFTGAVVGADFAAPMLVEGRAKVVDAPVWPVCGDCQRLPFPDAAFDGGMVAFGVRNLADLDQGLAELLRVLRPGARLVLLDFTEPPNAWIRRLYLTYFHRVLPKVGRWVSGHPWAYDYLPESVKEFPSPSELVRRMTSVGYTEAGWRFLSLGIAALSWGRKAS